MSRPRRLPAPGLPPLSQAPLYEASFLIDPARSPGEQDYRICAEGWRDDASKAFRHELESPIHRSLHELSGSGRYPSLRDRMKGFRVGGHAANRLILSIQIFKDRPEGGPLTADLNGLFLAFAAIAPDDGDLLSPPVVRPGYRLELGPGHLDDEDVTIRRLTGRDVAKRVARGGECDYEYPRGAEPRTGARAISGDEVLSQEDRADSASLGRLNCTVARIDGFRKDVKDEVQGHLNDYLATQDPRTAEAKIAVALYVNSVLDRLGFAIEYRGQQCHLNVTAGKKDQKGRFRLTPITTRTHAIAPANLADLLPLRLIDPIPARLLRPPELPEGAPSEWRDRVGSNVNSATLGPDQNF